MTHYARGALATLILATASATALAAPACTEWRYVTMTERVLVEPAREEPVTVTKRYYDEDGDLVRKYTSRTYRLIPAVYETRRTTRRVLVDCDYED